MIAGGGCGHNRERAAVTGTRSIVAIHIPAPDQQWWDDETLSTFERSPLLY
jgi:hypothetical protein